MSKRAWGNAIYVDFEGRAIPGEPPALLGVLDPEGGGWKLRQYVFDPDCADVGRVAGDDTKPVDLEETISALIRMSDERKCPIVSWSCHDIRWMKRISGGAPFRHRNAIQTARRWRRANRPAETGDNSLSRYLDWIGYIRPDESIDVGATIRRIRETQSVTARVLDRWAALLLHNRHDLLGMREVLRVSLGVREFDTTVESPGRSKDA